MKLKNKFKLMSLFLLTASLPVIAMSCQTNKDKTNTTTDPKLNGDGSSKVMVKDDSQPLDFLPPKGEVPETQTEARAVMEALIKDTTNWVAAPNELLHSAVKWDEVKKLERNAFVEVKYVTTATGFKFTTDKDKDLTAEIKAEKPKAEDLASYESSDAKEATLFFDGETLYIFGKEKAGEPKYRVWTQKETLTKVQKATLLLEDFRNYAFSLENVHHANKVNPVIYLSEVKRMWQEILAMSDNKLYITNKENDGLKQFLGRTPQNKFSNWNWRDMRKDAYFKVDGTVIKLDKYFPDFNNATVIPPQDEILTYEESLKSFVRPKSLETPPQDEKSEMVTFHFALYKLVDNNPVKHYGVTTSEAELVFEDK
ncbi:hypothetical protein [Mycoplasmopsis alligatoris]|uniref:Lipoprotein n=1 Tax=Mycoplasmopsis alligatoris A21JP2 TaxID=747682 RepID=D4XV08_9BACT|nr:hypothetical protein [Mycoplasmopsis alligatoris]EFF41800.1 hypothetical protein MALL_0166 [Mycoplasmopsis alligatoris A21JP2]